MGDADAVGPHPDRQETATSAALDDKGKANLVNLQKGKEEFKSADRDHSGMVDRDELRNFLEKKRGVVRMEDKELNDIFDKWDTNKDGKVDLIEFQRAMGMSVLSSEWLTSMGVLEALVECLPEGLIKGDGMPSSDIFTTKDQVVEHLRAETQLAEKLGKKIFEGLENIRALRKGAYDAKEVYEDSQDKFATSSVRVGDFGDLEVYSEGLDKRVGLPDENVFEAMRREHCEVPDAEQPFTTSNYYIETTSKKEWNLVIDSHNKNWTEVEDKYHPDDMAPTDKSKRRKAVPLSFFLKMAGVQLDDSKSSDAHIDDETKDRIYMHVIKTVAVFAVQWPQDILGKVKSACEKEDAKLEGVKDVLKGESHQINYMTELTKVVEDHLERWKRVKLRREEIIALRLYTGPMFHRYNTVLRKGKGKDVSHFASMQFATTLHAINSGLLKLQKVTTVPPGHKVYRGLAGMHMPERFWNADEFGCKGGVEYGFMSTTANRNVALHYSKGNLQTLFEITVGQVDRGAKIAFLSQYPLEAEFLFPPLSNMEVVGSPTLRVFEDDKDGQAVTVWPMRINSNAMSSTLDELENRRSTLHMTMFRNIVDETARELRRKVGDVSSDSERTAPDLQDREQYVMNVVLKDCQNKMDEHGKIALETPKKFMDAQMYKEVTIEAVDLKRLAVKKYEVCVNLHGKKREENLKKEFKLFGDDIEVYKIRCGAHDEDEKLVSWFPWEDVFKGKRQVVPIPDENFKFEAALVVCECIHEAQTKSGKEEGRFIENVTVADATGQARGVIKNPFRDWDSNLYFGGCNLEGSAGGNAVALLVQVFNDKNSETVLESLNLVGNSLGADGVAALSSLKDLTGMKTLNLSRNHLGDDGGQALSRALSALSVLPGLESLDLSGNELGDVDLPEAVKQFHGAEKGQTLIKELQISSKTFNPGVLSSPEGRRLFDKLEMGNISSLDGLPLVKELGNLWGLRKLKTLDLSGNHITSHGVAAFSVLKMLAVLGDLNLSRNDLQAAGAERLSSLYGINLKTLNLASNRLGPDGIAALSSLKWVSIQLESLILADNLLCAAGAEALVSLDCLRKLERLDLSQNELGAQGAANLSSLRVLSRKLKSLNLSGNKIKADGAAALSSLQGLSVLEELNLASNLLHAAGVEKLSSLSILPCMKALNLSDNVIGCGACKLFNLACISGLTALDISSNLIMVAGADKPGNLDTFWAELIQAIAVNSEIQQLNISDNSLGDEGAEKLCKILDSLTNLTDLIISDNNISEENRKKVEEKLRELPKLTKMEAKHL